MGQPSKKPNATKGYNTGEIAVSQINMNVLPPPSLPKIVPSPPSSVYAQTNVANPGLQAQTTPATEFTIYTLLPQDEPVIISSAEYLPLQDTNNIKSFGFFI